MDETLHEAIQASASHDEDIEGAVLTGWVLVAEWVAPDGRKWLTRDSGDVRGETPAAWTEAGWLWYFLKKLRPDVYDESDFGDGD